MAKKKSPSGLPSFGSPPFLAQNAVRSFLYQTGCSLKEFTELILPETEEEKVEAVKKAKLKEIVAQICESCGFEGVQIVGENQDDLYIFAILAIYEKLNEALARIASLEDSATKSQGS